MKHNTVTPIAVNGINTKNDTWKEELQQDSIYVDAKVVDLADLTGMKIDKGISKAIISENKIVNIVSPNYGFLPNEKFFYEVEARLIEADINYVTRSINRENKHFAVDYILNDESYEVKVKGGKDEILPMMRFTNSYAGGPTSGTFGFFRKVCSNGLHVANTKVGFKVRHKSTVTEIAIPGIANIVQTFMNNEFFSLHKKFEVLAERPITDMQDFIKYTCTKLDLFKYEASEKNPNTPSAKAKLVEQIITKESNLLGTDPNYWLGYNAFNEIIHESKKTFQRQRVIDSRLFNTVFEFSN